MPFSVRKDAFQKAKGILLQIGGIVPVEPCRAGACLRGCEGLASRLPAVPPVPVALMPSGCAEHIEKTFKNLKKQKNNPLYKVSVKVLFTFAP